MWDASLDARLNIDILQFSEMNEEIDDRYGKVIKMGKDQFQNLPFSNLTPKFLKLNTEYL